MSLIMTLFYLKKKHFFKDCKINISNFYHYGRFTHERLKTLKNWLFIVLCHFFVMMRETFHNYFFENNISVILSFGQKVRLKIQLFYKSQTLANIVKMIHKMHFSYVNLSNLRKLNLSQSQSSLSSIRKSIVWRVTLLLFSKK